MSLSDQLPLNGLIPDDTRVGVSVYLTLMTLVLYDHLITFDTEVERIWSLKWRLPKFLFLTSRYVVVPMLILIGIAKSGYALLPEFCAFAVRFYKWADALALTIAEIVLMIRVSALYGHSRVVLGLLIGMFTCQILVVVADTTLVMKDLTPILYHDPLPGCSSNTPVTYAYTIWLSFTCFDGILLILTLYRLFSYGPDLSPTIKLLARDSIVCFGVMFMILLENIIVAKVPVMYPFSIPPEWIACLTVCQLFSCELI
jgi:hypothetical protein